MSSYTLISSDSYVKRFNMEELTKTEHTDIKSLEYIDVLSIDPKELYDDLTSLSLFNDSRVISLMNLENAKKYQVKDSLEYRLLKDYLDHPNPDNTVFLLFDYLDKDTNLYELLKKTTKLIELKTLDKDLIEEIITNRVTKNELTIDKESIDLFVTLYGDKVDLLLSELEKLIVFSIENKKISITDTKKVIIEPYEDKGYNLTKAFIERNKQKALSFVNDFLKQGIETSKMVSMLISSISQIISLKENISRNVSDSDLMKMYRISNIYALMYRKKDCEKFSYKSLLNTIDALNDLDLKIKTGSNPASTFEFFILRY